MLGVIFGQLLEALEAIDGFLNRRDLVARKIAGHILAVLPGLVVVEGALRRLTGDRDFAAFHAWDGSDFLENGFGMARRRRREGIIHGRKI